MQGSQSMLIAPKVELLRKMGEHLNRKYTSQVLNDMSCSIRRPLVRARQALVPGHPHDVCDADGPGVRVCPQGRRCSKAQEAGLKAILLPSIRPITAPHQAESSTMAITTRFSARERVAFMVPDLWN